MSDQKERLMEDLVAVVMSRPTSDQEEEHIAQWNAKVEKARADYLAENPPSGLQKYEVPEDRLFNTLGPKLSQHWIREVLAEKAISEELTKRNEELSARYAKEFEEGIKTRPIPHGHYLLRFDNGTQVECLKIEMTPPKSFWAKLKQLFTRS